MRDGFTPEQRFFIGWGQMWCENADRADRPAAAQTNPHSPGRYRVNGVVSNMPEFQKAFSCKATRWCAKRHAASGEIDCGGRRLNGRRMPEQRHPPAPHGLAALVCWW